MVQGSSLQGRNWITQWLEGIPSLHGMLTTDCPWHKAVVQLLNSSHPTGEKYTNPHNNSGL